MTHETHVAAVSAGTEDGTAANKGSLDPQGGISASAAPEARLVRIQDAQGRGPWRPGFSHRWMTDENPMIGKPIIVEVKDCEKIIDRALRSGLHLGCAVHPDKLHIWFTQRELRTLAGLGFSLVDASVCKVLAETETQVLIGWQFPLLWLPPAPEPSHD